METIKVIELVYDEFSDLLFRQKRLIKIINEYLENNPKSIITSYDTNILIGSNGILVLQILLTEETNTNTISKTRA